MILFIEACKMYFIYEAVFTEFFLLINKNVHSHFLLSLPNGKRSSPAQ